MFAPGRHRRRSSRRARRSRSRASSGTTAAGPGGHTRAGHDPDRLTGPDLTVERAPGEGAPDHPPRRRPGPAAGASRTRPSPRCRSAGDGSVGDDVAGEDEAEALRQRTISRMRPVSIWSRIQHRAASASIGDGAVPRRRWAAVRHRGAAVTRRAPGTAGVSSPDSAALTRRLASSASTSESPASDGVEHEAGDVVGRRLGHVQTGGHVGVHEPDVDGDDLGVLGEQLEAQRVGQRPRRRLRRAVQGARRGARATTAPTAR